MADRNSGSRRNCKYMNKVDIDAEVGRRDKDLSYYRRRREGDGIYERV